MNNSMDRIKKVLKLNKEATGTFSSSLIGALAHCLSPSEVCDLLLVYDLGAGALRRALIRKLSIDITDAGYQACHRKFTDRLIELYYNVESRYRQSIAYVLSQLAENAPNDETHKIVEFFLSSKHLSSRRRAYKEVNRRWKDEYAPMLLNAWKQNQDTACAVVMCRHLTPAVLLENFDALAERLDGGKLSYLYQRCAPWRPELFDDLKKQQPSAYAYVCFKLGLKIADAEARKLIKSAPRDNTFGLLLWSLGKLGMWNVLLAKANEINQMQEQGAF